MIDLIKKSLYAGIGAVVLTKEKIQEMTRRLVEDGKITREESEKLAEEMVKSGERQWEEMSRGISDALKRWMENLDVVRRKELTPLEERINLLEQRISLLEAQEKREGEPKP
ncbi:MAG: hypothetical protein KBH99_07690 [Syntrophobacteraceae bacterium]|nr:hypothetical protein [Syntrophobacteraceae bacterium]